MPTSGTAKPQAAGLVQELLVSSGMLAAAAPHRGESRAPYRRAFPVHRHHRDESLSTESRSDGVLQRAGHRRTVDQRGQTSGTLDTAVVLPISGQRSAAAIERTGVQPGQPLAAAGAAEGHRQLGR